MSVTNGPRRGVMINALAGDIFDADFRQFLRAIDALLMCNVKSRVISTPPGSPTNGDAYIVGPSPTGAWAAHVNAIAIWTTDNPAGNTWEFYPAGNGMLVYSIADSQPYFWTGSAWTVLAGGGGGSSTLAGDTDVVITSPADAQVLTYEASSSKWKNRTPSGGGGGGASSGSPVVAMCTSALSGSSSGWNGFTLCMKLFAGTIVNQSSSWKVSLRIASGNLDVNTAVVLRTLPGSTAVIDSTPFTFNGVAGPWILAAGDHASDAISLSLDNDHDYYVMLFLPNDANNTTVAFPTANSFGNNGTTVGNQTSIGGGYFAGDETGVSTIGTLTAQTTIYGWMGVRVA